MSISQSLLIRITPKRRRVIAEVGDIGLVETVFTIRMASPRDANLMSITHQNLLPSRTTSKYFTTKDAHKETGISRGKLRRLAREGKVEAIKIQGKWLILQESLYRYIDECEA